MTAGSTYREAFEYGFSTLDPHSAHVDPPAVGVYETLLVRGSDGAPRPRMAESWTVSSDGLRWTVVLREDLRFHSGSACDAPAVVSALDALRWDMHVLPGGRQLWYWDPVDRVEALDSRRLRLHLHFPHPRLHTLLWGTHTAIHNEAARLAAPDDFGTSVVDGTGPYRLESWSPQRVVTRRADGRQDRAQSAMWESIPSAGERLAALVEGRVACAHALDASGLRQIEGDPRFVVARFPQPSSMYLSLDWRRTDLQFDDPSMRHALSLAIDRTRLVREGLDGLGRPSAGPLPPSHDFHGESRPADRTSVESASAALDRLGWTIGSTGVRERRGQPLEFECVIQQDETFQRVGELVASDLRAVGVVMRLRSVPPFEKFYRAVQAGPDAVISKWLWPDPVEALKGFTHTSTAPFPNWQHSSVAELDRAFDAFARSTTADEQWRAAEAIESAFMVGLPYVPLLTPEDVWAWSGRVQGFAPRHGDLYPLYDDVDVRGSVPR